MTYKWTIDDCDKVEMPMIHVLLGQIGELPPHDILINAQIKAKEREDTQAVRAAVGVKQGKVRRRQNGE